MMTSWQPQVLQVVWFTPTPPGIRADRVFNSIFGFEPQQTNQAAVVTPRTPFYSTAEADYEGNVLRVTVQPGRVDLFAQPFQDNQNPAPFPLLVNGQDTFHWVRRQVEVASAVPDVMRLAVLLTLGAPVDSAAAATDLACATAEVPYRRADGYSDVIVQVNRRMKSGTNPGLEVNRLLRVLSLEIQQMFLGPDGNPVPTSASRSVGNASQWLIDVNSVPADTAFAAGQESALLSEIFDEVARIWGTGSVAALRA